MYTGPLFLADLVGLLLRFRLDHIAIISDIEKAYLQIRLQQTERDLVRFFWVKNPSLPASGSNLVVFRFTRVPFGIVCSAFLLGACLLHHFSRYPGATANYLSENLYVDNIVVSLPNVESAKTYYHEAKHILSEASMNLRQWYTNSSQLIEEIASEDRGKGSRVTSVLGLVWDTSTDTISCPEIHLDPNSVRTKRQLMQFVAKVFDPCGLFSPVMAAGKMLVQRTWQEKLGWDDQLSTDIIADWKKVGSSIHGIPSTPIPRFVGQLAATSEISLHCFCDASTKCYATAIYIKSLTHSPCLIFSKTKMAPTKSRSKKLLSIPQLELMAVLIGTRNLNFISDQLKLENVPRYIWTDSQCVLHWVTRKNVSTVFVKNRVKEIFQSKDIQFRYVKSEDNPADVASRGSNLDTLSSNPVWWHGPGWLAKDCSSWEPIPDSLQTPTDLWVDTVVLLGCYGSDVVPQLPHVATTPATSVKTDDVLCLLDYDRYSDLPKMTRVLAWVLRFVSNCRNPADPDRSSNISAAEIASAKGRFVKAVQARHFADILAGKLSAGSKHFVQQLNIRKDQEGLLRCMTRLSSAVLPSEAVHPILLPSDDHYTRLAIKEVHAKLFHAGTSHCLSEIGQSYWIPKGRARVRSEINSCKLCRRLIALRFKYPNPPPLPRFRVAKAEVFQSTGLDYLGPLYVRSHEGDQKVWILIFTCAAIRAVQLEVVEDMTTQQFLLAFRRFSSLYGYPSLVISDNAKQFKTADAVFRKVCFGDNVQQFSASNGIVWKFIPERAPWFGGFYERLVSLVKRCLRSSLHMAKVSVIELQTIVYEVAACLNTRPITYVDSDVESIPLSPSNFLLKGRNTKLLTPDEGEWEPPVHSKDRDLVLEWRRNNALLDKFWSMWQKSYLTSLKEQERSDKQHNVRNIEPSIGMTVLVADNKPKGQWQLARIVRLYTGSDGNVISADVVLPSGTKLKRAIKLLCPLEESKTDITSALKQAKEPASTRTPRRAALQSSTRTKAVLDSEAADSGSEGDEAVAPVFVALLHFPVYRESKMQSVSEMEDQERRLRYVDTEDQSRTYYIGSDDNLLGLYGVHAPGFFIGEQLFSSVFMAACFAQAVQDGHAQLAHDMHLQTQLRSHPWEIPFWFKERGYEPSAKSVFQFSAIIQVVFEHQFQSEGPLRDAFEEVISQQHLAVGDRIHSCGKNYVWDCGIRFTRAHEYPHHELPGFDEYGKALEQLTAAFLQQNYIQTWTAEQLMSEQVLPATFAEKTVLVISDSMCKLIKDIAGRGKILYRRGGTFKSLRRMIQDEGLHFGDYNYVIIHCGINDVQRGQFRAQDYFLEMLDYVYAIEVEIRGYPADRVLFSCPLRHPSHPDVVPFSFFIEGHCLQLGMKCLNWGDRAVADDPFINPHYFTWNARTSARDFFHINHAGIRALWSAWCGRFPLLRFVDYGLSPEPRPPQPADNRRRRRRGGFNRRRRHH